MPNPQRTQKLPPMPPARQSVKEKNLNRGMVSPLIRAILSKIPQEKVVETVKTAGSTIINNKKKITIATTIGAETLGTVLESPITFDTPNLDICDMPLENAPLDNTTVASAQQTNVQYQPQYVNMYTEESFDPSIQTGNPSKLTHLDIMQKISKNPTQDRILYLTLIGDVTKEYDNLTPQKSNFSSAERDSIVQNYTAKVNTLSYLDQVINRPNASSKKEFNIAPAITWYLGAIDYYATAQLRGNDEYYVWRNRVSAQFKLELPEENIAYQDMKNLHPDVESQRQVAIEHLKAKHFNYFNKMSDNIQREDNTDWTKIWAEREIEKSKEFYIQIEKQLEIEKTKNELNNVKQELNENCSKIIYRCNLALKKNIEETIPHLENMKKTTIEYMKIFQESVLKNKWLTLSASLTIGGALLYRFGSTNMLKNTLKGLKNVFFGSGPGVIPPSVVIPPSLPPFIPMPPLPSDKTGYGVAAGMILTKVLQKVLKK